MSLQRTANGKVNCALYAGSPSGAWAVDVRGVPLWQQARRLIPRSHERIAASNRRGSYLRALQILTEKAGVRRKLRAKVLRTSELRCFREARFRSPVQRFPRARERLVREARGSAGRGDQWGLSKVSEGRLALPLCTGESTRVRP